jgi:hypothetical protein
MNHVYLSQQQLDHAIVDVCVQPDIDPLPDTFVSHDRSAPNPDHRGYPIPPGSGGGE